MSKSFGHLLDSLAGRQPLLDRIDRIEKLLAEQRQQLALIEELRESVSSLARMPEQRPPALPFVTVEQMRAMNDRVAAEALMRAMCMVVPIDATTALCRVLGRYKMYLDRRDVGFAPHLMFEGYWEYWVTEFIWRNVQKDQVVLDVGANHGYYTLLLADLVGPGGHVHAFEPNPRMADLLQRTIALNGFWNAVTLHSMAVGESSGSTMRFLATEQEPKNGRLMMPGEDEAAASASAGAQVLDVPVRSLDDAVAGPVDFMKIDVEGAEELAWRGMKKLVARSPNIRIVMEFNCARCRTPAETLGEIAAMFELREIGFDGLVHGCRIDDLLRRSEDAILYLSKHDAA